MQDQLTIEQVIERVGRIAGISDDDEMAHSREDALYRDVLQAIVDAPNDTWLMMVAPELARIALTTKDIEFARWCA